MDSGERGMNSVAMTINNPRKEYQPSQGSNQRPPVLKSLPTEQWGSAYFQKETIKQCFYAAFNIFQLYHGQSSYNYAFPEFLPVLGGAMKCLA